MKLQKNVILRYSLAAAMLPASQSFAMQTYIPGTIYIAGDQVCYQNDLFKAKWWAGESDSPADVDTVAAPWDTPWERMTVNYAECSSNATNNTAPSVSTSANPSTPDASGFTPVTLIATASDADGDTLSYQWQQTANGAPSAVITNADQADATATLPEATQSIAYQFQVTVRDGKDSITETLAFTLTPEAGNQSPVAVAAAEATEITGSSSLTLSATDSYDPDGDILSYQWQQISPAMPLATLDDATSLTPQVTFPDSTSDTSYVFELVVNDGMLSASDSVTVIQRVNNNSPASCPAWQDTTIYIEGDYVSYNDQTWRAHWWTQNETPGSTGEWGVWRLSNDAPTCADNTTPEPEPEPGTSDVVKLSKLQADESALTGDSLLASVKSSIRTLDNATVEAVAPGLQSNPDNVKRVENIISEQDWNYIFPRRAAEYTYVNFLKAVAKFPAFCGDYTDGRNADAICRKALATMFAHFTQETGGHTSAWPEPEWRQGLVYLRELGWNENMPNGYGLCDPSTWQGDSYPCAVFEEGHAQAGSYKSYFGRGAKQLSYNYNYGPFSVAMFGDVNTLLQQPNLVADTWLNLASAVFFYVYPQPPKPSMLHALDGTWQPNQHDLGNGLSPGFGVTTQIINGGIECGGTAEHIQSQNRIDYYLHIAEYLNVPIAENETLGCANMQRFDTQGSGALSIYWEQDWSQANACKRVNYQTPFSALTDGDYVKCVDHYFDITIDYDN